MMAARVAIPPTLRASVLKLIHEGHAGVVRSKALARSLVWWPELNHDIESMCGNCQPCTMVIFSRVMEFVS